MNNYCSIGREADSLEAIMTVPLVGKARRLCAHCAVEIEVTRPDRAMGAHTSRSQRESYAKELRRQILWEAVAGCDSCHSFWNAVVRRAAEPILSEGVTDGR